MRSALKLLLLLFLVAPSARAGGPAFTAVLDHDDLAVGETAVLSLRFENISPQGSPQLPPLDGLAISEVSHQQVSSSINGESSTLEVYAFPLTPQRAGAFTIPALVVEINGQKFSSEPVKFTVRQPSAPSAEAVNSGQQAAFFKLNFPKEKIYTGESAVARLELYLRDDVQDLRNFQITSTPAEGFSVGKPTELPNQRRRVQIGNRVFTVIPLGISLTAVRAGALTLGPVTAGAVLMLPSKNNQEGDPFAQFGVRSPFFHGEQRQVTLATEAVNIESLPLPVENRPANFSGAIGDFTLTANAGPTTVTVGDPITLRVQISGRGALDAVTLPLQDAWQNFKLFPPTSKMEPTDQFGFQGKKTFEQIISPLNSDVHELPPLTFAFFNPADGQYHTLTQPAVPLTVKAAGATPLPALAAEKKSTEEKAAADILPIKNDFGALVKKSTPLLAQPGFLAAQTLPIFAFLAAFVWRKRTDSLANNPRLRRQRAVAQLVAGGINDLNRFAAENKSPEFFALLFRLLQEQLGERLDCPASAITEADVTRLAALKAGPETLKSLHELFQFCNQARYAPIQTRQELAAIAAKFKQASGEVQELKA